jgi:hypothetical protein
MWCTTRPTAILGLSVAFEALVQAERVFFTPETVKVHENKQK